MLATGRRIVTEAAGVRWTRWRVTKGDKNRGRRQAGNNQKQSIINRHQVGDIKNSRRKQNEWRAGGREGQEMAGGAGTVKNIR